MATSFGLQGTKETRCMLFHTNTFNHHIFIKRLRKMNELRFLSVCGYCSSDLEFSIVSPDFPNALRYMRWSGLYPQDFKQIILLHWRWMAAEWYNFGKGDKERSLTSSDSLTSVIQ
uniref:Uncharacterized protein n=1 Tax=Lactuca sativa TaxID=4236 RepID=A0A9R1VQS9_LACSA|nr:hypothetical protein LSAT_V11C400215630 [Lactuca sativa]